MLFNSNMFLFVFLPLSLLIFHGLRSIGARTFAFIALLFVSIVFYAYWSLPYCLLFAASVSVNYLFARAILVTQSRLLTAIGIVANLLLLGYFKYTNFLIDVINEVSGSTHPFLAITLPIGISFYTFIQIAFLADVYAGKVREPRFLRYGLFVSFFPHMLAGPIVHHKEMMPQFGLSLPPQRLRRMLAIGLALLILGLVKKVLIADRVAQLADPVFVRAIGGEDIDFFSAWVGALAYTFQIYFDFSGYSDMAIGLALMFGIRFPANFNSPYKAGSIITFWRRWHMTLSRLLQEYIYIPLGGNRKGPARRYTNLMATMLIGGAWHGAGWAFILWGGLHGIYLVINHLWNLRIGGRMRLGPLAGVLTFFAVVAAWIPFRAEHLGATFHMYQAMVGLNGLSIPLELGTVLRHLGVDVTAWGVQLIADNYRTVFYTNFAILLLAMVLAFAAPNSLWLLRRYRPVLDMTKILRDGSSRASLTWRPGLVTGVLAGAALFLVVRAINSAAPSAFLYFQF